MNIPQRLDNLRQHVNDIACACGRDPKEIKIIGVTKGQPVDAILQAWEHGLTDFAESYWQEAQPKLHYCRDLPLTWHFIGPLQSNKIKSIAQHFDWIHSVSRMKEAHLLNQALESQIKHSKVRRLNICVQVNIDLEETKSGVMPKDLPAMANHLLSFKRLDFQGLMAIPRPHVNEEQQLLSFERLAQLLKNLNHLSYSTSSDSAALVSTLDPTSSATAATTATTRATIGTSPTEYYPFAAIKTLSMGMSHDFPAAIRAGATMLRIGEAIFGKRIQMDC